MKLEAVGYSEDLIPT